MQIVANLIGFRMGGRVQNDFMTLFKSFGKKNARGFGYHFIKECLKVDKNWGKS